jgi:hypothetical protein
MDVQIAFHQRYKEWKTGNLAAWDESVFHYLEVSSGWRVPE